MRHVYALVGAVSCLGPAVAAALELRVPTEGLPTIQSAVDAAQPGDTIIVEPGTYRESITISGRTGLTLRGEGRPKIDAQGVDQPLVISNSTDIQVKGSRLLRAASDGVSIDRSQGITIADSFIKNTATGHGIRVSTSHGVRLMENTITKVAGDSIGMPRQESVVSNTLIRNCGRAGAPFSSAVVVSATEWIVEDNQINFKARLDAGQGEDRDGIQILSGDRNIVRGNEIRGFRGVAIQVSGGERQRILRNAIHCSGNTSGILIVSSMKAKLAGNHIEDCRIAVVARDGSGGTRFVDNVVRRSISAGMVIFAGRSVIKRNRIDESGWVALQIGGLQNRIAENTSRNNGRDKRREGWRYDVVDAQKKGRNLYRDNDFSRGILYEFDDD